MKIRGIVKKIVACSMMVCMGISMVACGKEKNDEDAATKLQLEKNVSISLWYDDDRLTPYFQDCANKYHDANEQVTVELKLVDSENYLTKIYDGCVKNDDVADIFLMSSTDMQRSWLMGLDRQNANFSDVYVENHYGKMALESCRYKDKLYGYPLTFSTNVMVYNTQFAKQMDTFEAITSFSDNFEHTEENSQVEQVIQWDVSSAKLNYGLIGAYINVGGEKADERSKTSLFDDKVKECLNAYVSLQDAYGIVRSECTYEYCLNKFKEGKLLYTIVDSNDLGELVNSGVNFGVQQIPNYNNNLQCRTMSVTDMLMVTPYTENEKVAESVAKAFTYDYATEFGAKTGLPSARKDAGKEENVNRDALYNVYEGSSMKARYMDIGDFYIKMEIMLHQVWDKTLSVEDAYGTFKNYVISSN